MPLRESASRQNEQSVMNQHGDERSLFAKILRKLRTAKRKKQDLLIIAEELAELIQRMSDSEKPVWRADQRALYWRGRIVKQFRRAAATQEAMLAAFEERGWPSRIDDPLEIDPDLDPKERLRETVKRLNCRLATMEINFYADGTGCGICWERTLEKSG